MSCTAKVCIVKHGCTCGRVEVVLQENVFRTMERSSVAIEGVGLCGDSIRVGDRAFRSLVQVTLDILLKRKSDDSFIASNPVSIGSLPHLF